MPAVLCNARTIGRNAAEQYLRDNGLTGREARSAAAQLVPELPHGLTKTGVRLRALLVQHSDITMAATIAETLTNSNVERINALGVQQGTNMMAQALTANAMIRTAADWWASGTDPAVSGPDATAALRSFSFELPSTIQGSSYDAREGGR